MRGFEAMMRNPLLRLAAVAFLSVACFEGASWLVRHASAQGIRDAQATNHSIKITTGLTYQTIAVPIERVSLTFQANLGNTANDICYIEITGKVVAGNTTATSITVDGTVMTAAQASITLNGGGAYGRYVASVPGGVAVVGTCTSTGDAIYVDSQ
jgi:hypothetical protein